MTSPRGARSDAALAVLAEALCSEGNESARRAGCYGLGAAGDRAVPTLIRVLETTGVPALVAGLAVESLGEAAMTPDARVVAAMDAACWVQHDAISTAEESPETTEAELPLFEAGGMVSHVNDMLQVPIMLPIACRPASRPPASYLRSRTSAPLTPPASDRSRLGTSWSPWPRSRSAASLSAGRCSPPGTAARSWRR